MNKLCLLLAVVISTAAAATPTPIVIWHGMGDSYCDPISVGPIMRIVEEQIPGIYMRSLKIGNTTAQDIANGFLMPIKSQVELACKLVKEDTQLAGGFNAMGFSQGGQFLRALVQQCDGIKMLNLITFGGQHQGVFGFPHCPNTVPFCDVLSDLLMNAAYVPRVQDTLVQAQYWQNPLDEKDYKEKNIFLPDLNNENAVNELYKKRLTSLKKFVMVRFNHDTVVQPIASEWFGFYAPGQQVTMQTLQESELYKSDRLGLRVMDKNNQLVFLATDGDHLQIRTQWFIDNIVSYLR